MGAILSGQATCGVLVGSSIAIGLLCGKNKDGIPEEHEAERNRAINAIGELYRDFLKEFGSTDCRTLSYCDFSNPEDIAQYIQSKGWEETCDKFLSFVIRRCIKMSEEGII